jgi:hypothetical protein
VDCARGEAQLNRELRAHIGTCAGCRERWETELQLTAHLNVMRESVAAFSSPATSSEGAARREAASRKEGASGKETLMREFARRHRRKAVPAWAWTLAAAASILLAIFIGHEAGVRSRHTPSPAVRTRGIQGNGVVMYEVSADASALSTDDFLEVPYTPPLAPGEIVRMVHTEIYPETLASMGVAVDTDSTGNLPVDMVVGEDGLPRAIRISENNSN